MREKKRRLRVVVYIGWHRWCDWRKASPGDPDEAETTLRLLAESRHDVCGLIVRRGDRLADTARRLGIPVLTLHPALCMRIGSMRALFAGSGWRKEHGLAAWMERFAALGADLGFVYAGGWVPPVVYNLPELGFINFHPGPLPQLPGYYPESILALRGAEFSRGTVHRVVETFDHGEILAFTRKVRITTATTAKGIGVSMLRACIPPVRRCFDKLADGSAQPLPPPAGKVTPASLSAVNAEGEIKWRTDSHAAIERRVRCFCCTPWELFRPLRAELENEMRTVLAAELHPGTYPGTPGEVVGRYAGDGLFHGAPLVRTREGVAVTAAAGVCGERDMLSLSPEYVVHSGKRRRQTVRSGFEFFDAAHRDEAGRARRTE